MRTVNFSPKQTRPSDGQTATPRATDQSLHCDPLGEFCFEANCFLYFTATFWTIRLSVSRSIMFQRSEEIKQKGTCFLFTFPRFCLLWKSYEVNKWPPYLVHSTFVFHPFSFSANVLLLNEVCDNTHFHVDFPKHRRLVSRCGASVHQAEMLCRLGVVNKLMYNNFL